MALRSEIQEFVDAVAGRLHPDEPVNVHVHHIVREGFDVVGLLLNAGANVDELSNEAVAAAQTVIGKLKMGAIARRLASAAAPLVVPSLVEQLASFSGTADEFSETHIIPRLNLWIETLTSVRDDLAGKAE